MYDGVSAVPITVSCTVHIDIDIEDFSNAPSIILKLSVRSRIIISGGGGYSGIKRIG